MLLLRESLEGVWMAFHCCFRESLAVKTQDSAWRQWLMILSTSFLSRLLEYEWAFKVAWFVVKCQ